jgi:FtsZ-interacting cell division protein ZipA
MLRQVADEAQIDFEIATLNEVCDDNDWSRDRNWVYEAADVPSDDDEGADEASSSPVAQDPAEELSEEPEQGFASEPADEPTDADEVPLSAEEVERLEDYVQQMATPPQDAGDDEVDERLIQQVENLSNIADQLGKSDSMLRRAEAFATVSEAVSDLAESGVLERLQAQKVFSSTLAVLGFFDGVPEEIVISFQNALSD